MKIAYNPKTGAALTTAPANNDITFDLSGLNIFVRGEKFKGTDTTYSVFKKHTSSSGGGYNGLVPVPSYTTTNIRFLREDGTWKSIDNYLYTQITNQDLNTLKTEGKWYHAGGGNTTTNKPSGVGAYELYVGRNANDYRYLKLITSDGIIWFRYHNKSTWTSWIRWYTDANTDYRVKQSTSTTTNFRPLILGYNNSTDKSVLANDITNLVYTTTTIYAQPSSGTLYANKFIGKIDWSNIDGKPSSFTPATHYHSYLKGWSDTRTVATTPNDYNDYFKVVGIKTAGATLGLTSTQAGSYATIIGWRGWRDNSGGYAWEIASTDKNRLYVRSGSETTWNNGWSAIAYTTDTYPTSQINKLTGYKIATSVAALATTDTLNTALGKIEYKLNIAYDLVTKANDSDGTIENLKEILDVLSGISDTETIKGIVGKYLPLTGGTLTGILNLVGSQYQDSANTGALNLNNSDIYGVNSIKFLDLCNGPAEGLLWYRDSTHVDTIWVQNGVIYFTPNREWGTNGTKHTIYHSGNLTASVIAGLGILSNNISGNAATSTIASLLNNTSVSDPSTAASGLNVKWYSPIINSSGYAGTNYGFPALNNANGILWLGTHSGPYGWLMGFSSNGRIYARYISNNSFSTTANGGSWNRIAWTSDIPTVTNYYWANVQVSSSSSTTTTPTFATATATTSITTPLVTSSGVLTLNGVSGVYLKYNNSDGAAIVLSSTYFKPFDSANNKLSLGTSSARWSNIYSVLGNFSGLITATSGVLIGSTADIGWYLNSGRITAGTSVARDVNVGSLLVSNAWADASKVPTNGIYSKGKVSSAGFVRASSSNSYILLGGGGHKALSDFMLKSEELTTNLTTISKSLTVTQAWMDTGITSTNLPANGTYIVLIQVSADDSTGNMYSCYSSGVMSWYKDSTNDTETDEIILHRSGQAYGKTIYLRTVMLSSGVLKLLIGASSSIGKDYTYTFKFKRII